MPTPRRSAGTPAAHLGENSPPTEKRAKDGSRIGRSDGNNPALPRRGAGGVRLKKFEEVVENILSAAFVDRGGRGGNGVGTGYPPEDGDDDGAAGRRSAAAFSETSALLVPGV